MPLHLDTSITLTPVVDATVYGETNRTYLTVEAPAITQTITQRLQTNDIDVELVLARIRDLDTAQLNTLLHALRSELGSGYYVGVPNNPVATKKKLNEIAKP